MNSRVHYFLLRPGRFFLYVIYLQWILCISFVVLLREKPPLTPAFLWWGVFLPLSLGLAFSGMLQEPMHRSFGVLLPDMRNRFRRSQLKLIGIGAAGCGWLGSWVDGSVLFLPFACLAAASFSLALPFELGWSWAGSRGAAVVATGIIPFFAWQHRQMKEFFLLHPWLAGLSCLVFVTINFFVAFSRERWRARANNPRTSQFSAILSPEFTALRKKETPASDIFHFRSPKASWRGDLSGSSLKTWFKAIQYERTGRNDMFLASALGYVVGTVLIACTTAKSTNIVQSLYQLIVLDLPQRSTGSIMWLPVLWSLLYWGPRPYQLYPLSRNERAKISFAAFCWQIGISYTLVAGIGLLVAGLAAHGLNQPLDFHSLMRFLMKLSIVLPLAPFVQWCRLHVEVNEHNSTQMVLASLCLIFALPLSAILTDWITTPVGAALWALAIAASFGTYYSALKKFYRSGDLIQLTKRTNLSLA